MKHKFNYITLCALEVSTDEKYEEIRWLKDEADETYIRMVINESHEINATQYPADYEDEYFFGEIIEDVYNCSEIYYIEPWILDGASETATHMEAEYRDENLINIFYNALRKHDLYNYIRHMGLLEEV